MVGVMLFSIFHILGRTATHLSRPIKAASRWDCGPILVSCFYAVLSVLP